MENSSALKIPNEYKSMISQIDDISIKELFTSISFIYYSYFNYPKSQMNDKEIQAQLELFLKKYQFMTYQITFNSNNSNLPLLQGSKLNESKNKISLDSSSTPQDVNVIICVEKNCILIEHINLAIMEKIFTNLKKDKHELLDTGFYNDNDLNDDIKKEINNFCKNFIPQLNKNVFVGNTIRPIIAYTIRRFFYPSRYFEDPSFFAFNTKNNDNENQIKTQLNNFLSSSCYKYINSNELKCQNVENIVNSIKYQDHANINTVSNFNEKDFIILRDNIYINETGSYFLVIHLKSFHIFMMKKYHDPNRITNGMRHEIEFCSNFSHRCITKFYGFVKEERKIIGCIYEYMSNGSLDSFDKNKMNVIFSLMSINRIFNGIDYLHSKRLIHRDLKPSNILIDHDFLPCISDFETIRFLDQKDEGSPDTEFTGDIESPFYASPELEKGKLISFPSDIYQFGLIIYYLFEKKHMKKEYDNNNVFITIRNASKNIQDLFRRCIQTDQKDRPNMNEIKNYYLSNEFRSFNNLETFLLNEDNNINLYDIVQYLYEIFFLQKYNCIELNLCMDNIFSFHTLFSLKMNGDMKLFLYYLILYHELCPIPCDFTQVKKYLEKLAQSNNSEALLNLGYLYLNGKCVEQNYIISIEYFKKASFLNNYEASLFLGDAYFRGLGNVVKIDKLKAIEYYKHAAKYGYPKALFILSKLYYTGHIVHQDFTIAKKYLEMLAIQNHPEALYRLGEIYFNGFGVKRDYLKAKEYFELSAKQNNPNALYQLANIYFHGYGIQKDLLKAKEFLELSAKQNNPDALLQLGYFYFYGYGIQKDFSKAKEYFEYAASLNNLKAFYNLGSFYFNGYGVQKVDYAKAKEYYEKAAQNNDPNAMHKLGICYLYGFGCKKDYSKAKKYLDFAAKNNISDSYLSLGYIYLEGLGQSKDIMAAIDNYNRAAELNNPIAYLNLGMIYYNGNEYIKKNIKKALENFEKSAQLNNSEAFWVLGYIYQYEEGIKKDYLKAKYYYLLSAALSNPKAYYSLGNIYFKGIGVQRDYMKARKYYENSAKLDNSNALFFLSTLYTNGDIFDLDLQKAINYLKKYISISNKVKIYRDWTNKSDIIDPETSSYYRIAFNNLGLILILYYNNDVNKVEEGIKYIKEAALAQYQFSQYIYGLIYELYDKESKKAELMYKRSCEKHIFALAEYKLGHMIEKNDIIKANEYYENASDHENLCLFYKDKPHIDKRLEISKTFILRLTNLKLFRYYFQQHEYDESEKYFTRSFNKLINDLHRFEFKFKGNDFSYLMNFILYYQPFNLVNQFELEKIKNNHKKSHINNTLGKEIQKLKEQKFKIEKDKFNDVIKNEMKHSNSNESNEIIFGSPKDLFIFIKGDQKLEIKLLNEIQSIINIMDEILNTAPYSILFGRINIEKPKKEENYFIKDVNDLFYGGFSL